MKIINKNLKNFHYTENYMLKLENFSFNRKINLMIFKIIIVNVIFVNYQYF